MKNLNVVNKKPVLGQPVLAEGTAKQPYDFSRDMDSEKGRLETAVIESISTVFDPEIPVNVFDLGLIYAVDISDDHCAKVRMTLTAPNCPVAQALPEEIRQAAANAAGISSAEIEVVWEPPWNRGMMSEAAELELNL